MYFRILFPILLSALCTSPLLAQSINPIVGDTSWHYFARTPVPQGGTHEELRIQNHLMYVYGRLVERPVGSDSRGRRVEMLDQLLEYMAQGNFPQNFYHPEVRRPCFIDDDGRLCAVAYLVAQTAGQAEAERINQSFRFHYLLDIKDSAFAAWQSASGLSMHELAMIQPSYYVPHPNQRSYYPHYCSEKKKYGLRMAKGQGKSKRIHRCRYDEVRHPQQGSFFFARKGEDWILWDEEGHRLPTNWPGFRKRFKALWLLYNHAEQNCLAQNHAGFFSLYDPQGEELWQGPKAQLVWQAQEWFILRSSEGQSLYNLQGSQLIQGMDSIVAMPDERQYYDDRIQYFKVLKNGQWGIFNLLGQVMEEPQYPSLKVVRGLIWAEDIEGDRYLIAPSGKRWALAGEQSFEAHRGVQLPVNTPGGMGILNTKSEEWLFEPQFERIQATTGNYFLGEKQGLYGLYSWAGERVLPPIYRRIQEHFGLHFTEDDSGKMGLFNYLGEVILPSHFDTLSLALWNQFGNKAILIYGEREGRGFLFRQDGSSFAWPKQWDDSLRLVHKDVAFFYQKGKPFLGQFRGDSLAACLDFSLERVQAIGARIFITHLGHKKGLWQYRYHTPLEKHFWKQPRWQEVKLLETEAYDKFLVREDALWGVYSLKGDSLVIPCAYDAYYPPDLKGHSNWVYFRKNQAWQAYYYTQANLKAMIPVNQQKIERLWRESKVLKSAN